MAALTAKFLADSEQQPAERSGGADDVDQQQEVRDEVDRRHDVDHRDDHRDDLPLARPVRPLLYAAHPPARDDSATHHAAPAAAEAYQAHDENEGAGHHRDDADRGAADAPD